MVYRHVLGILLPITLVAMLLALVYDDDYFAIKAAYIQYQWTTILMPFRSALLGGYWARWARFSRHI